MVELTARFKKLILSLTTVQTNGLSMEYRAEINPKAGDYATGEDSDPMVSFTLNGVESQDLSKVSAAKRNLVMVLADLLKAVYAFHMDDNLYQELYRLTENYPYERSRLEEFRRGFLRLKEQYRTGELVAPPGFKLGEMDTVPPPPGEDPN